MTVTVQSPRHALLEGQPFYFCRAKRLAKFNAEPAQYTQPTPAAPAPTPAPTPTPTPTPTPALALPEFRPSSINSGQRFLA